MALVGDHLLLQSSQHVLNSHSGSVPVAKAVASEVHLTLVVHRWEIDLGVELAGRSLNRVVFTADNREEVNAAVECGTRGANDSAVPVGEGLIVGVVQTVTGHGVARAVLTGF